MPDDNRDIFDKALEVAPLAGAALGGAAARKLYDRKVWQSKRLKDFHARRKNLVTLAGAGAGYTAGVYPSLRKGRRK
ncbi:MAG: hypothetical protein E6Q97_24280 [Desulfurellales bacterium]|nr:MAG: hypothetical protein E6Q97_24280 [Desulfurellales bacterium]